MALLHVLFLLVELKSLPVSYAANGKAVVAVEIMIVLRTGVAIVETAPLLYTVCAINVAQLFHCGETVVAS